MTLEEAERLARERWPLNEYSRREYITLYEHHEEVITALQHVLTMLKEERYYVENAGDTGDEG